MIKTFLTIYIGTFLINAPLLANELTQDETNFLKNCVKSVSKNSLEACLIERDINKEAIAGRALLLFEKKNELKKIAQKHDEEILAFYSENFLKIEWLPAWFSAYIDLTVDTPAQLSFFLNSDREISSAYIQLRVDLRNDMESVVDSNGEPSNIEAMRQSEQRILDFKPILQMKKADISTLVSAPYFAFNDLHRASVIERLLETESIVGRALLLQDRMNKLVMGTNVRTEELQTIVSGRSIELEWPHDWLIAYIELTNVSPSLLATYERENEGKAVEFSKLIKSLQQTMQAVAQSNGEISKIEAMNAIAEKLSFLKSTEYAPQQ